MSLGDYVRYMRAMRGGISTRDVMQGAGLGELRALREIEQRYREVGDDETLEKLAKYFEVPVEELKWRRSRSRKALSGFVNRAMHDGQPVQLKLRTGETLTGKIRGWDLGCIGLEPAGGGELVIVQRHVVEDWETMTG
jgi:hypothetical protein